MTHHYICFLFPTQQLLDRNNVDVPEPLSGGHAMAVASFTVTHKTQEQRLGIVPPWKPLWARMKHVIFFTVVYSFLVIVAAVKAAFALGYKPFKLLYRQIKGVSWRRAVETILFWGHTLALYLLSIARDAAASAFRGILTWTGNLSANDTLQGARHAIDERGAVTDHEDDDRDEQDDADLWRNELLLSSFDNDFAYQHQLDDFRKMIHTATENYAEEDEVVWRDSRRLD